MYDDVCFESYVHTYSVVKMCFNWYLRLSAQLLQTTWEQTELQVESDLQKLQDWSLKFDLFAGKQAVPSMFKTSQEITKHYHITYIGFTPADLPLKPTLVLCSRFHYISLSCPPAHQASMDFKYLNDRYQRGRAAIQKHMDEKMIFTRVQSLVLAHGEIVRVQAEMGQDGFLDFDLGLMLKRFNMFQLFQN